MSRPVNVAPSTINQKPSLSLPRTSKEALVSSSVGFRCVAINSSPFRLQREVVVKTIWSKQNCAMNPASGTIRNLSVLTERDNNLIPSHQYGVVEFYLG